MLHRKVIDILLAILTISVLFSGIVAFILACAVKVEPFKILIFIYALIAPAIFGWLTGKIEKRDTTYGSF